MKTIKFLILITFITSISFSQTKDKIVLSGNLSADAKIILNNYTEAVTPQLMYSQENKKSPILAGVMSLLIPGSGEIYVGEYLKAGIFLVIEAAVVTTAIVYDGKGDDKTTEFQNYADDYTNPEHNWSVLKYAEWLITYEQGDPNMILSNDPNRPPWEQVDWDLLNASEKGSHKLPPHGDQQYYELIGKYHQYSSGWNDFTGGGNKDQISPNLIYYSGMRGEANDFYSVASTAVIGIYVNHFLSALDAVWSATQFNKDLAVKVRLENIQYANRVEYYPKIYFTYSF
jgi:TM2 domain-containing membrane protein YozV